MCAGEQAPRPPGQRAKGDYHWQQAVEPAAALIEALTSPGYVVVDPFCGTGTYGVAAVKTDRLFIGIDLPPGVDDHLEMMCYGLPEARWEGADKFHLTLRFIGEVDGRVHREIVDALQELDSPSFTLGLKGMGMFPPRGLPTSVWAGISDPGPVLASGQAYETWCRMIAAQGGDPEAPLPVPAHVHVVPAPADGTLTSLDAYGVGVAAWRLGAGRARKEDPVQAAAGIICHAKPGDAVRAGDPLLELHTDTPDAVPAALAEGIRSRPTLIIRPGDALFTARDTGQVVQIADIDTEPAYAGNRRYTFASDAPHRRALPRFLAVAAAGVATSAAFVAMGTLWLQLPYLVPQAVATMLVLAGGYALNRRWSFA